MDGSSVKHASEQRNWCGGRSTRKSNLGAVCVCVCDSCFQRRERPENDDARQSAIMGSWAGRSGHLSQTHRCFQGSAANRTNPALQPRRARRHATLHSCRYTEFSPLLTAGQEQRTLRQQSGQCVQQLLEIELKKVSSIGMGRYENEHLNPTFLKANAQVGDRAEGTQQN